jgi:hypothetical protein
MTNPKQSTAIRRTMRERYDMQGSEITRENSEQEFRELELSLRFQPDLELKAMLGCSLDDFDIEVQDPECY